MFARLLENEVEKSTAKPSQESVKRKRFVSCNTETVKLRGLDMLQACSAVLITPVYMFCQNPKDEGVRDLSVDLSF